MKTVRRIWKARFAVGIGVVAFSVCFLPAMLPAQVVGGAISGTVSDSSGAVIPNAQITIKNKETNAVHTTAANGTGFYSVPDLDPGTYDLTSSASGFGNLLMSDIVLTVGARLDINPTMTVGKTSQTVTVQTGSEGVDLQTSALSTVVTGTTIVELPLNGRSWVDLANLQPGVAPSMQLANGASGKGSRGVGAQVAISGNRPDQNNYRLDGITINDFANSSPGGELGTALGVDAIEEFSVLTSNYSADYGRASGGVFNAVIKSGTNAFHGSAYEFVRNSGLDARNYFDGSVIPPFQRNQFGASGGGPIRKDTTFIFGDYEGLLQNEGITELATVPSAAARAGNLSTGTITVSPAVLAIVNAFYPLPNGPLIGSGDTGNYSFPVQNKVNENYWTLKGEQIFSPKDTVTATYLWDHSYYSIPDTLDVRLDEDIAARQMIALQESHTFSPQFLNSFRLGFSRSIGNNTRTQTPINPNVTNTSFGSVPGQTVAQLAAPGITTLQGGLGSQTDFIFYYNSIQVYDDLFLTKGINALKAGFAFERIQDTMAGAADQDGYAQFGTLPLFLEGTPKSFLAGEIGPPNVRHVRNAILSGYIQDDIRLRTNLTANVGLRYEMATVPFETHGLLSSVQNIFTSTSPHLGSPYFANPSTLDFEPRLGLVWDPFSTGKTSVRAGFGMYDMQILPYQIQQQALFTYPFFKLGTVTSGLTPGSYPSLVYNIMASQTPATYGFRYSSIQPNPSRPYVMQWNINAQRQLPMGTTVTIGYVGSRGIHAPYHDADADLVLPSVTQQGIEWPTPVGSGTKLNSNFAQINTAWWIGQSSYNALELEVLHSISHGLQIQGTYTWGNVIDNTSGSIAADQFANSQNTSPQFWDPRLGRGLADFNIAQNLIINGIWEIPTPSSTKGLLKVVAQGWELGGIYKAHTGLPFMVGISGDPLGQNSSDPRDYPNRLTGSGCKTLTNSGNQKNYVKAQCLAFPSPATQYGNLRRNSLIGPGLSELDSSFFKNNKITDKFGVQFRAEIFNIANRVNFSPPVDNDTAFSATGAPVANLGLIDSTLTTSRQIQFGIKLLW